MPSESGYIGSHNHEFIGVHLRLFTSSYGRFALKLSAKQMIVIPTEFFPCLR